MKTALLFIVLFFVTATQSQIIQFTDAAFKLQLLVSSSQYPIARDWQGTPIAIDSNGNHEIEISEALQVYELQLSSAYDETIYDVTGLVYFSNLRSLDINYSGLAAFDATPFQQLIHLNCIGNDNLSYLNVSGMIQLETIWASGCNLTALDVSGLVNLKDLNFAHNNITTVNFDGCENLEIFVCSYNNLQQLDFTGFHKLKILYCNNNPITTLDVSGNPDLKELNCYLNDELTSIYMKNTTFRGADAEEVFHFVECPNLEYICTDIEAIDYISQLVTANGYSNCRVDDVCNLGVSAIDNIPFTLFPNPAADVLNIISNQSTSVTSIAVYNLLGQKIITKEDKAISSIDVSTLPTGNYFIKINSDKGTTNAKFAKK